MENQRNLTLVCCLICILNFSGCGEGTESNTPSSEEVITVEPSPEELIAVEPASLPEIFEQVRSGQWVHAINFPWDNYGGDFGENTWGYRGLANQGPSGWRRETRDENNAAKKIFWASIDDDNHCMGVNVELTDTQTSALVYFQIDELSNKNLGESVDLTGQTVSAQLYLPDDIQGPSSAPSGAMIFLQDSNWNWVQTPWTNISDTNQWITITANIDDLADSSFTQDIIAIGIKVGKNSSANGFSYSGSFYIDNVIVTNTPEIQFDFETPDTRTESDLKGIADLNITAVRWWLFADGRAGLIYDDNGYVTGLDDVFLDDFNEMIRLSRSTGVYLIPVLFDFLMAGDALIVDDVKTFGNADLINDPAKRQSLLDNAISPIFDILAGLNEVIIVDLFNEPEWTLLDSDIDISTDKRPPEIQEGGVVSLATMQTFFAEIISLYEEKNQGKNHLFTVGSASPQWVTLWEDLQLDIAQFHLWNGTGQVDEGLEFDFPPPIDDMPVFLGEFSTLPGLQDTCEYLANANSLGYSGALPWAYRAKDTASLSLLGSESQECMLSFSD